MVWVVWLSLRRAKEQARQIWFENFRIGQPLSNRTANSNLNQISKLCRSLISEWLNTELCTDKWVTTDYVLIIECDADHVLTDSDCVLTGEYLIACKSSGSTGKPWATTGSLLRCRLPSNCCWRSSSNISFTVTGPRVRKRAATTRYFSRRMLFLFILAPVEHTHTQHRPHRHTKPPTSLLDRPSSQLHSANRNLSCHIYTNTHTRRHSVLLKQTILFWDYSGQFELFD